MSLKTSRRHFIMGAVKGVASLGAAELLFSNLLSKLTSSAFASTLTPNRSGYYFHLSLPSAPPRWLFDLPLTPMGKTDATFMPGGFGTTLGLVSGVARAEYEVVKKVVAGKTLYLPPVWNYHTSKNFDTVLAHTLFVRGMNMEIDNHNVSNQRQIAPIIGGLSINGAVADKSERPLPSITEAGSASGQGFKSERGSVPAMAVTGSLTANVATPILAAFRAIPTTRLHNKDQNLALQDQVFQKIEVEMFQQGYTENALTLAYEQASELISGNIQSLGNNYPALRDKYLNLIQEAVNPKAGSLAGLNQSKIVPNGSTQFGLNTVTFANSLKVGDLRNMSDGGFEIPRMAQNFALMELFTDRLSTNFAMSFGNPSNVLIDPNAARMALTNDQHKCGVMVSTYITTLYYRALLGCLAEFVSYLKARNIFQHSVIHIGSEFNRNPRTDGSGSDHGVGGSCTTLISGKFTKPEVIGNILMNGAELDSSSVGTWGAATNYQLGSENRPINVNDVSLSITAMLGVSPVVANGRALVQPSSGTSWVPQKVEARNVKNS